MPFPSAYRRDADVQAAKVRNVATSAQVSPPNRPTQQPVATSMARGPWPSWRSSERTTTRAAPVVANQDRTAGTMARTARTNDDNASTTRATRTPKSRMLHFAGPDMQPRFAISNRMQAQRIRACRFRAHAERFRRRYGRSGTCPALRAAPNGTTCERASTLQTRDGAREERRQPSVSKRWPPSALRASCIMRPAVRFRSWAAIQPSPAAAARLRRFRLRVSFWRMAQPRTVLFAPS
jgi:hypothetical protein